MGNGTIEIVRINRELGFKATTLETFAYYNYVEGHTDEEGTNLPDDKEFIYPIEMLTIADLCQVQSSDPSFSSFHPLIKNTNGSMSVDEVLIWDKVKTLSVSKWSQIENKQQHDLNLGTASEPNIIQMDTIVPARLAVEAEELFHAFKDVLRGPIMTSEAFRSYCQTQNRVRQNHPDSPPSSLPNKSLFCTTHQRQSGQPIVHASFIKPVKQET